MNSPLPTSVTIAYQNLLHHGLQLARDSLASREYEWSSAEVEHLHNIPSLLFEANIMRHVYYYDTERAFYIERTGRLGIDYLSRRIKIFYEPAWQILEEFVRRSPTEL